MYSRHDSHDIAQLPRPLHRLNLPVSSGPAGILVAVFALAVAIGFASPSAEAYTLTYNDDKAGLAIVADRLVQSANGNLTDLVRNRISLVTGTARRVAGEPPSRAAGNTGSLASGLIHGWSAVGATFFENDDVGITADFDGNVLHIATGLDAVFHGRTLIGVGTAIERSSVDTDFNFGEVEGTGLLVFPYFSHTFDRTYSVSGHFGYGVIGYEMDRLGGTVTGTTTGHRYFVSATGHAEHLWHNFIFSGAAGLSYVNESHDGFVESDGTMVAGRSIDNGELSLSGRTTYHRRIRDGSIQPYVLARLEYDFISERGPVLNAAGARGNRDDLGVVLGTGVDIELNDSIRTTIAGEIDPFRGSYRSYSILGKVRIALDALFH